MPIILDPNIPNPTPTVPLVSADGVLTAALDDTHGGVLLEADFSTYTPQPVRVQFRRTDGTPVRSGDPATAPGGIGVAYDHEAPLGVSTSWVAVPVNQDGTTGTVSQPVTVTLAAPTAAADWDCWLKPLNNPNLAMRLPLHDPDPTFPEAAQLTLGYVPGSRYPAGTWDRRTPGGTTFAFRVKTVTQRDTFKLAIDEGPMLFQARASLGVPDMYCLAGALAESYRFGSHDPRRDMTLELQPIDRPPTIDAPLFIPGRSWGVAAATAATWADLQSTWPTWANVIGLP